MSFGLCHHPPGVPVGCPRLRRCFSRLGTRGACSPGLASGTKAPGWPVPRPCGRGDAGRGQVGGLLKRWEKGQRGAWGPGPSSSAGLSDPECESYWAAGADWGPARDLASTRELTFALKAGAGKEHPWTAADGTRVRRGLGTGPSVLSQGTSWGHEEAAPPRTWERGGRTEYLPLARCLGGGWEPRPRGGGGCRQGPAGARRAAGAPAISEMDIPRRQSPEGPAPRGQGSSSPHSAPEARGSIRRMLPAAGVGHREGRWPGQRGEGPGLSRGHV